MISLSVQRSSKILLLQNCREFVRRRDTAKIAITPKWTRPQTRAFCSSNPLLSKSMKVAVLGASTRTGNCLSLLLKQSTLIDELAVFDIGATDGLALELSHIDARCKVSSCGSSEECLRQALQDAKVVMIVAGQSFHKSSTSGQDMTLKVNAEILSDLLPSVIRHSPRAAIPPAGAFDEFRSVIGFHDSRLLSVEALVAISMTPINSLLPLATEMYKKAGVLACNRLFGVTTPDCVRANTFAADVLGIPPECVVVPVIGGGCSRTCIPLFSQMKPCNMFTQQEINRLMFAVRTSEGDVYYANNQKEGSVFCTAFASARFCMSLCKAIRQQPGVVECAYVRSCVVPEVTYFAAPLELGPEGIQKHLGMPQITQYERKLLTTAIPVLRNAIKQGETIALGSKAISTEICPTQLDPLRRALKQSTLRQSQT